MKRQFKREKGTLVLVPLDRHPFIVVRDSTMVRVVMKRRGAEKEEKQKQEEEKEKEKERRWRVAAEEQSGPQVVPG